MHNNKQPAHKHDVLLLGGAANSLSAARSLGRNNISVSIAAPADSAAARSRYIKNHYIQPAHMSREEFYYDLLLQQDLIEPGTVIFACGDHSISMVAKHKKLLNEKYILDIQKPEQQLALLNKQQTLDLARSVGCHAPGYWNIETIDDVNNAIPDITFPVLIKPIYSHIFQQHFKKKLFYTDNSEDLIKLSQKVFDKGIEFMLCEFIPGPDTLLSSFYIYADRNGDNLFEFTKQIIRRSPINFGQGTYHRTMWLPKTAAEGLKFYKGINFTGLGNIEFKFDTRDNLLKVIECNARFTSAQELITKSGLDMPFLIYQHLVDNKKPSSTTFKDNFTLVMPFEDFDAFRDLRRLHKITTLGWLKSLLKPQVFSYFSIKDIKPFLFSFRKTLSNRIKPKIKNIYGHYARK